MSRIIADLRVAEALPSWNVFIGSHYREYSKARDRWKLLTLAVLMHDRSGYDVMKGGWNKPEPEDFPLTLLVIVGKKRGVLDSSNIAAKFIEDALKGTILPDDSPKYVEEVRLRSRRAEEDFTRIVITTERVRQVPVLKGLVRTSS